MSSKCSAAGCTDNVFQKGLCVKHYGATQTPRRGKAKVVAKNKAAIDEMLTSLRTSPKFVRMAEYSVECLCGLVVDDSSAEELIESGAIEAMMDVLRQNPGNEKIQALLNKLVSKLSRNAELAAMVGARLAAAGMKSFASALENKSYSPETIISTCEAVNKLMAHTPNVQLLSSVGTVPALSSVIKRHPGNMKVLTAVASAMAHFAVLPGDAATMMGNGAVAGILKGVENNIDDLVLAKAGVKLIAGLCKSGIPLEPLKELGAVDILVAALEYHPFDMELQEDATNALKALTNLRDMDLALMLLKGDVAMDARMADAMAKVASLMLVGENIGYLFESGGIDAVMAVLKQAIEDGSDQAVRAIPSGFRTLTRACNNEEKNVYQIMKKGGVKCALTAAQKYPDNEAISEAALNSMTAMVTRKENGVYLGKQGAMKTVGNMLAAHPDSVPIALAAAKFMTAMSQWPETTAYVVDGQGIEELCEMLTHHMKNAGVCDQVITALGGLATSEENINRMKNGGLMNTLLAVMQTHPQDAVLVSKALMLVETMSLVPANAVIFGQIGALEVIKAMMDAHPEDEAITRFGGAALQAIRGVMQHDAARLARIEAERLAAIEAEERRMEEEHRRMLQAQEARRVELERLAALERSRIEEEQELIKRREDQRRKLAVAEEEQAIRLEQERRRLAELAEEERALALLRLAEEEEDMLLEQRRLQLEAEEALERLRAQEEDDEARTIKEKQRLIRKKRDEEEYKKQQAEKEHLEKLLGGGPMQGATLKKFTEERVKTTGAKNARALFDDDDGKKKLIKLDPEIKEFLLRGMMLMKHSKTAAPRKRHVYMTTDCTRLCWKNVRKPLAANQYMEIAKIFEVRKGRCTPQLERKRFGRFLAREDCAFAIFGSALTVEKKTREAMLEARVIDERTIDLECTSPNLVAQWVAAITHLIEWIQSEKLYGQKDTAVMKENPLVDPDAPALDSDEDTD